MLSYIAFYLALFLMTLSLTFLIYRYAKVMHLIAIPEDRSSHADNTATGGGLALAVGFLLVIWLGFKQQFISPDLCSVLLGGAVPLALIGFWDDIKPLPIRFRMAAQATAVLWAIYWLGSLPTLNLGRWQLYLGHVGPIVTFLLMVWVINLYNFMDGIDGLAGTQGMTIAISAALIAILNQQPHAAWLYTALAATISGFLFWNWPRAQIFMGDAGSGFLGYLFAVLVLQSAQATPTSFWVFTILFGIFLIDATLTLLRRIIRGEPFYQPHCTHTYQLLAQHWQSHRKVTLFVLCINLFWLFPWAIIANHYPSQAFTSSLFALMPIIIGCSFIQIKYIQSLKK